MSTENATDGSRAADPLGVGERVGPLGHHRVHVGRPDPADPQRGQDVDETAEHRVLLLRQRVGRRRDHGVPVTAGFVVGGRGGGVVAFLAQAAEQLALQHPGEHRGRSPSPDDGVERHGVGAVGEVGRRDGQRRRRGGHRAALTAGQIQGQARGHVASADPEHRVVPGEVPGRPGAQVIRGDHGESPLGVGGQSVVAGAVAPQGQRPGGVRRAAAVLRPQDLLLGLQPARRQVPERGAHAGEEGGDVLVRALAVEGRPDRGGRAVVVAAGPAGRSQREVGEQVGDARAGQRLVGPADPEHQPGPQRPGGGRDQRGHAVDLGVPDHQRPAFA
ncbi:hypothetical protein [Actinoplanes nipponensis]|uniref:hypothetical protein n=1 Tax=Actinoplanes nipponensis TaxID=135950 RepID=UPI0031ED5F5C